MATNGINNAWYLKLQEIAKDSYWLHSLVIIWHLDNALVPEIRTLMCEQIYMIKLSPFQNPN